MVIFDKVITPLLHAPLSIPHALCLQEKAGCKMQMIQDGQYASTPEKPLRMTGAPESCKVWLYSLASRLLLSLGIVYVFGLYRKPVNWCCSLWNRKS